MKSQNFSTYSMLKIHHYIFRINSEIKNIMMDFNNFY